MISHTNGLSRQIMIFKLLIASVLIITWAAGCSSTPSESPEKFVLNFIKKHIPMTDRSAADFYVKEERAGVVDRIQAFIASGRDKGILKSLNAAKYDFSNIKVKVLDEKEDYVQDEEKNFVKVAAKGSYTKTVNGKSESLMEDEIIILESVRGQWQVTEKINPWK